MKTISKTARQARADADRARQRRDAQRAREDKTIDAFIAETGWAVCINEQEPNDESAVPGAFFGYTIGRSAKGMPELCTWAERREDIHSLLNVVGAVLDKANRVPVHDDVINLPQIGPWLVTRVLPEQFWRLEHARNRYTFLRAVHLSPVRRPVV